MSTKRPIKAVVMAGGTGGHVFPALSVAQELRQRGLDVSWLGTRRGIEAELVPAAQIPLNFIEVEGIRGKGAASLLKAPFLLLKALWQAMAVLKREKPDLVLGFGGFASGPGGLAARLKRTPLVIHEQNAVAGTTNKLLSRIASRVLEAFPSGLKNAQQVGNPVRPAIAELTAPEQRYKLRQQLDGPVNLLVLGGSLGALAINQLLPQALAKLPPESRPQVWHQTGKAHVDSTREAYQQQQVEARVEPFIDDMAAAYAWADLVICRAGAVTVSEVTAAGVASVLVPFPYAIDDHQTKNGEWLVNNEAALIRQQHELDSNGMAKLLSDLINDRDRLLAMAQNARALALPQAATQVADICLEVAHG